MIVSIILNTLIVIIIAGACASAFRIAEEMRFVFRFFTVLSNILCAAASLLMVIFTLAGEVPDVIRILKYSGTCAVTVTFLTVMFFLLPTTKDFRALFSGYNFFLHLLCPVLAIVSWLGFENPGLGFYIVIFGTLPVALYAGLYLYKVLLAPAQSRWDDFYGFNWGGRWPVSAAAMICSAFAISVLLWAI